MRNRIIIIFGIIFALTLASYAIPELLKTKVDLALACSKDGCSEKVFLLHGQITSISNFSAIAKIKYLNRLHPEIDTICISSSGGATSNAMSIADTISDLGLNTCLASGYELHNDSHLLIDALCESSCTWMVLAGKERILYDDKILLGFHASRDHLGNRADGDLEMLIDKVNTYIRKRPDPSIEINKLSRLSWWAFQQGPKTDTTDCTAHELQSKYPYFTDIRSWSESPANSCGLKAPEDVKETLN